MATNDNAQPNTTEDQITQIHETLSDPRRRHALRALHKFGPTTKDKLSRLVAAYEYEKHPTEVTDKEEKRIYISLHQAHLPYLSQRGFVIWDDSTNDVALGPKSDQVLHYLDGIGNDGEGERPESLKNSVANAVGSIF